MHKQLTRSLTTTLALLILVALQPLHADWDVNYSEMTSPSTPQDIVVSLATDPNQDPEAACLAVTFARSLSGNEKANITLFVTLDGVNLASEDYITKKRLKKYECTTPATMRPTITLRVKRPAKAPITSARPIAPAIASPGRNGMFA